MTTVCFLLGGFQGNGGIGRVVSILAPALAERPDLRIVTVSYLETDAPLLYPLPDRIIRRSLYHTPTSMTKAMLAGRAVAKLTAILKEEKADLVVACGALYYPISILAARRAAVRCVCWEHTNPAATTDYRFQGLARRFAVKRADTVVVLTKAAERYYREVLKIRPEKLHQLYNPVSPEAARSRGYDLASRRILSVGRLSYQKNFSALLEVAARVLPSHPDWSWDIFGTGEEYESLSAKIEDKQLVGRVNLCGQVSDLYDRYARYAFQVMTSRYEGFPMSLLEGGVNRLPLVSFDIETGPDEIIEDGINGYLIAHGDIEAMADRITALMENEALRAAQSEQSFALCQRFVLQEIVDRWCHEIFTPQP